MMESIPICHLWCGEDGECVAATSTVPKENCRQWERNPQSREKRIDQHEDNKWKGSLTRGGVHRCWSWGAIKLTFYTPLPTKDHKVERRLLLEPLDNFKSTWYKYMHMTYWKSDTREQGKCNDHDVRIHPSIGHGLKAGMIEILEANRVSYSVDTEHLETTIIDAMRRLRTTKTCWTK